MNKKYMEVCLNPVRQRIIQTILVKGEATSAQIGETLSDIPRASLYRHLKILLDAEVIHIVKEETRRGAIERTYAFTPQNSNDTSSEELNHMVQGLLMNIGAEFSNYFAKEDCNCERDLVSATTATLLMTDEEYLEFMQQYASLVQNALQNNPAPNRKPRKIVYLSLPT